MIRWKSASLMAEPTGSADGEPAGLDGRGHLALLEAGELVAEPAGSPDGDRTWVGKSPTMTGSAGGLRMRPGTIARPLTMIGSAGAMTGASPAPMAERGQRWAQGTAAHARMTGGGGRAGEGSGVRGVPGVTRAARPAGLLPVRPNVRCLPVAHRRPCRKSSGLSAGQGRRLAMKPPQRPTPAYGLWCAPRVE
jgi:hypothetical protein